MTARDFTEAIRRAVIDWATTPGRKLDGTETFTFERCSYDVVRDGRSLTVYPMSFGKSMLPGRSLTVEVDGR